MDVEMLPSDSGIYSLLPGGLTAHLRRGFNDFIFPGKVIEC